MGSHLHPFELPKESWVHNEVGEGVPHRIDLDPACGGFYECLPKMTPDFVVFPDEGLKVNGVLS